MQPWVALLATFTFGPVVAMWVTFGIAVDSINKIVRVEAARKDVIIPVRWGIYSKKGLYWYSRRRRDRRSYLYGSYCGLLASLPIVVYAQSVVPLVIFMLGGALVTEFIMIESLAIAIQDAAEPPFTVVRTDPALVSDANERRVVLDCVGYFIRGAIAITIAFSYLISVMAFADERFGPKPGVLDLLSFFASLFLSLLSPWLYYKYFLRRKYVTVRAMVALTSALNSAPDPEPDPYHPHPLRLVDPSLPLRESMSRAVLCLEEIGRRLTASQVGGMHPIAVVMWTISDRMLNFLKSPTSLKGELTLPMRQTLRAALAILAGPKDPGIYSSILDGDEALDADWSGRAGKSGNAASVRFVSTIEHLERLQKGTVSIAIIIALIALVTLAGLGKVDWKDALDRVFG